jgi:hypothetical protein
MRDRVRAAALSAAVLLGMGGAAAARQDGGDKWKFATEARDAIKTGDTAKAKAVCADALKANPDSLALRYEIAQVAELRRDNPYLAYQHYAEISAFGERATRLKEKLSDEDAKLVKDAAAKAKTIPDGFARDLSKALKSYADTVLKTARMAKTKKNWTFTGDIARNVKTLFNGLPGVLDPKDPRESEATKHQTDALGHRAEDKVDVADSLKAEVSEAVGGLAKELNRISDLSKDAHEEVRGPFTRRRALMPLGILIALHNDPDGHAKKSEAIWKQAREVEPRVKARLRLANDASRWTLRLNGLKVGESEARSASSIYKDLEVEILRDSNLIGFFGHEITDKKRGGRAEWAHRVWVLVDVELNEKEHITTDAKWQSVMKAPAGWDDCLDGPFDFLPITSIGEQGMWDYETTKTWKGETVMGDVTDTYIRRIFDLPASVAAGATAKGNGAASSRPKDGDK